MELEQAIEKGRERLARAIEEYNPEAIFAGFSGGSDSLVATHLLNEIRDDVGTLHINTGIGMKRTRKYVRDSCKSFGWDLVEYKAKENGYDYDEMVRGNVKGVPGGFPGPPMHTYYYRRLKERQLEQAHRDFKGSRGNKIMLVTGIRGDESWIRAGYDEQVKDSNGVAWVSLIYDISAQQKQKYIDLHDLDVNPVSEIYGMSGECLCGAFDEDGGRLTELKSACHKFGEPETYQRIVDLQEEVWDAYPWRWDQRRPEWFEKARGGQLSLDVPGSQDNNRIARMCVGCGKGSRETTWVELIEDQMQKKGDAFPEEVVGCSVALEALEEPFVRDHHGDSPSVQFELWTEDHLYFSDDYDGLPFVRVKERSPKPEYAGIF